MLTQITAHETISVSIHLVKIGVETNRFYRIKTQANMRLGGDCGSLV
jgi:hypothetical protein